MTAPTKTIKMLVVDPQDRDGDAAKKDEGENGKEEKNENENNENDTSGNKLGQERNASIVGDPAGSKFESHPESVSGLHRSGSLIQVPPTPVHNEALICLPPPPPALPTTRTRPRISIGTAARDQQEEETRQPTLRDGPHDHTPFRATSSVPLRHPRDSPNLSKSPQPIDVITRSLPTAPSSSAASSSALSPSSSLSSSSSASSSSDTPISPAYASALESRYAFSLSTSLPALTSSQSPSAAPPALGLSRRRQSTLEKSEETCRNNSSRDHPVLPISPFPDSAAGPRDFTARLHAKKQRLSPLPERDTWPRWHLDSTPRTDNNMSSPADPNSPAMGTSTASANGAGTHDSNNVQPGSQYVPLPLTLPPVAVITSDDHPLTQPIPVQIDMSHTTQQSPISTPTSYTNSYGDYFPRNSSSSEPTYTTHASFPPSASAPSSREPTPSPARWSSQLYTADGRRSLDEEATLDDTDDEPFADAARSWAWRTNRRNRRSLLSKTMNWFWGSGSSHSTTSSIGGANGGGNRDFYGDGGGDPDPLPSVAGLAVPNYPAEDDLSSTSHDPLISSTGSRRPSHTSLSNTALAINSELSRSTRGIRQVLGWAGRRVGFGAVATMGNAMHATIGEDNTGNIVAGTIRLSASHASSISNKRRHARRKFRDARGRLIHATKAGDWKGVLLEYIPMHPWSIFLALSLFAGFAIGLTFTLIYVLNPDKSPLPWREYCQSQHPEYFAFQFPADYVPPAMVFPPCLSDCETSGINAMPTLPAVSAEYLLPINSSSQQWPFPSHNTPPFSAESESVDQLAPVGIFVGVMTMDRATERRMMIRQTYNSHWKSRVPGTEGVRVRFILGKPSPKYAKLVELEMETYKDMVILDVKENMNYGKTHAFFAWAAENATVPDWQPLDDNLAEEQLVLNRRSKTTSESSRLQRSEASTGIQQNRANESVTAPLLDAFVSQTSSSVSKMPLRGRPSSYEPVFARINALYRGEKRPDYIVKADDDSFIMLGELERRLRVTPRRKTFWGYLVKRTFMAGECYGLSIDLVDYIAKAPALKRFTRGAEDKLVAKWMRMHPERDEILWASERCWIYDHPKASTVYSHGYLYPSTIDQIRSESVESLSEPELLRRGGQHAASTYSSVSKFGVEYRPPRDDLTQDQEVEALVEGSDMSMLSQYLQKNTAKTDPQAVIANLTDYRPSRESLFRNDPKEYGGTVVVHFIKRHDWFMETALALLGPKEDLIPNFLTTKARKLSGVHRDRVDI